MDCKEPKCIENYKTWTKEMGPIDDDDFEYFHCSIKNCHDISLGRTSFACDNCGGWACQDHIGTVDDEIICKTADNHYGEYYCDSCIKNIYKKCLVESQENLKEIIECQNQPKFSLHFKTCSEIKCIEQLKTNQNKRKWERLIHCEVMDCHEMKGCNSCNKCFNEICENHCIYLDYSDKIYCFNCCDQNLKVEFNRLETQINKLELLSK